MLDRFNENSQKSEQTSDIMWNFDAISWENHPSGEFLFFSMQSVIQAGYY